MKSFPLRPCLGGACLTPGKKAFLTGTILLTSTGLICRVLGFFYRIFMSRTIGAEGLGLYNMVHPLFSICFALCAGSIQSALSQYIAAHPHRGRAAFKTGLSIALALSFLLAWIIASQAPFLAEYVLMESRCAPFLPVMAFSVPFAALHACINGYYYGTQKSRIPAFSQVAEQVIRMGAVFLIASIWLEEGRPITVSLAVYGHLIGEMASAGFTLFCLGFFPPDSRAQGGAPYPDSRAQGSAASPDGQTAQREGRLSFAETAAPLMALALPLMGNRLLLNVLGSAEAIWIPNKLEAFGLTNSQALSIYGVFTSMALPFVLFPSAITNSMAVLLLPYAAQARAQGNERRIETMISMSLRYSCYMGILCIGLFTMFGGQLGQGVFHNQDAGFFIAALSWLCPFMYLASPMGSILNGLGKTSVTFFQNTAAMVIRLLFVLFAIPSFGILAYLWGMLASELALALMCCLSVHRLAAFSWDGWNMLAKPALFLLISIGLYLATPGAAAVFAGLPSFLAAVLDMGFISLCYGGLLLLFHRKRG